MLSKSLLFDDMENFNKILKATEPDEVKSLGRNTKGFDNTIWRANVVPIACDFCYQKFTKVPGYTQELLATGDKIIAESTDEDELWGTGYDMTDEPKCYQPWVWTGLNILGFALMVAREKIRSQDKDGA